MRTAVISARPLRRGLRLCLAAAGAAACLTASASAALPAPPDGTLATSFGDGGRATLPIPGVSTMFTRGEAIQRDGKVVVAGYGLRSCGLTCSGDNNVIVVARYDPAANRLDPNFGDGGVVITDFTAGSDADVSREEAHSLALTSDGKIVVAGSALRGALTRQLLVARYTSDGDLDPTFDGDGKVLTPMPEANVAELNALGVESDGSIVAAGNVAVAPNPAGGESGFSNIALARYLPDGSLDANFGNGGIVARASLPGIGQALARRGTSILVTGSRFAAGSAAQRSEYVLARFNADGTVDRSFGDQGSIGADFSTSTRAATSLATGIGVLLDGRIVVSGEVEQTLRAQPGRTFRYAGVARFTAGGRPDSTLNADGDADGRVLVDLGGERAGRVSAMLLDPFTGTLHLAGSAKPIDGAFYQAALARVLPNGALDRSFGPLGRLGLGGVTYLDDPRGAEIRALATRRDGTLTAAGNQFAPAPQPFLARFLDRTGCSPLICR
jgi:uncharacterized delta-60 repeat protein